MVLHSLQKRQVLVTKWASHLSCYQWGQPEDWRRPATKLLVCKAARAEAFVSNTKETKTWSGWAPGCNPAISGEVCAQSTLELPLQEAEGRSGLYVPTKAEPSLLHSLCFQVPHAACSRKCYPYWLSQRRWSLSGGQNPQVPLFTSGSRPLSSCCLELKGMLN